MMGRNKCVIQYVGQSVRQYNDTTVSQSFSTTVHQNNSTTIIQYTPISSPIYFILSPQKYIRNTKKLRISTANFRFPTRGSGWHRYGIDCLTIQ